MPNEMEEAYLWLEQEQNRPEVEYLKHLIKQHKQLLSRQMETTDTARRDRDALRVSSRQLAEVQEELETKKDELRELMRLYRLEKDMSTEYGERLTKALNMLARVKDFCDEMENYGAEI